MADFCANGDKDLFRSDGAERQRTALYVQAACCLYVPANGKNAISFFAKQAPGNASKAVPVSVTQQQTEAPTQNGWKTNACAPMHFGSRVSSG